MLANERLIYKMSLDQKIKLITSLKLYENSPDENYEFPVFELSRNPLTGSGVFATQFPSDRALASSWNLQLIDEVYKRHGEEVFAVKPYSYFNVKGDVMDEGLSEDCFLSAKSLASKISGLSRAQQFSNFEEFDLPDRQSAVNVKDVILTDSAPRSIYAKSPDSIESYKKQVKDALFYGVADSVDEALKYLFKGCTIVFLKSDFTEEIISRLQSLTILYRSAYEEYRAGEITVSELDRRCQSLEVFDETIIDEACDRLISVLLEMRESNRRPLPCKSGLTPDRAPLFDEVANNDLALTAARQSAVLIKNNKILPLANMTKIAILGEFAKDFNYQSESFGGKATRESTPFSEIYGYEINAVGFAGGYERGNDGSQHLIDIALGLAKEADAALVYLSAENGEKALPKGQLELIDALYKNSVKIIAVVSSDGALDCAFTQKCAAVLLTHRSGQEGSRAVLDILKGVVTPSGRLTETIPVNGEVSYPFGFGLSYTEFEYKNLKISERGISCTIKNAGGADGYAVPQFYLQKPDSAGIFKKKVLRGFKKVFIKKGDAVRVEIPFDGNTFKVFDSEKNAYRIEGGEYIVTVGENYLDNSLSGTVTLSEFVFVDEFSNETVEKSADASTIKFDATQEPPEVKKAKKQLSFGLKLFVAIMLFAYYEGLMAVLAFTEIVAVKDLLFYCVIGGLALLCLVLFIVYVVLIAKKRKKQHYVPVNDVLTDLVENVKPFDEIAKVTYAEPVAFDPEEEEAEEEINAVTADAVEEETYEVSFAESEEEELSEHVTYEELCSNFQSYARHFGVQVDIASVRSLFAAVSASKIVVVNSKNTEVLPDFLTALNGYFHGGNVTCAGGEWGSLSDLLWKREGEKFVVSDFTNAVYSAVKSPDRICAAVISGVNSNLVSYFAPFIKYANHPTEEHTLTLNEDLAFRLPDNFVYILSPAEGCNFPREVADSCLQLDLALIKCEAGDEVETKNIPKADLSDLVKDARENYFMSEKVWKKLDDLFETICQSEKFRLGNKNTLQLEKFSSVILECGGDESECITGVFLAKIVPLLKLTKLYSGEGGEKTLFGYIEKLFNEEELTKIQRSLSKAV